MESTLNGFPGGGGVWSGVTKGVEDGRRPYALWAGTHETAVLGLATHRVQRGRAWRALAIL
jgi:hypothetical protein